ncbi:unnamed protein product [Trichogramma brassicae]|uniref:Uncharacterized protein n=1 Tax=Trichogramma brassicae TaxID=86971 RepID=A0A6H5HXI7_9HYME|nr:unnamed protein product [Trichogramma brassicae]
MSRRVRSRSRRSRAMFFEQRQIMASPARAPCRSFRLIYLSIIVTLKSRIDESTLLDTVSADYPQPVSTHRSSSHERDVGENSVVFSGLENTTVYYGECGDIQSVNRTQQECLLRRVQLNHSRVGPAKEDECKITLSSESGGIVEADLIEIEPLDKKRAIVSWFETTLNRFEPYRLRLSVVDFCNCKIKTTKLSKDLDKLIENSNGPYRNCLLYSLIGIGDRRSCGVDKKFNKLKYLKGEDDFEVVSEGWDKVYRSSIDSQGVASKVDTLLTYPEDALVEPLIVPLSKDKGYLFIETSFYNGPNKILITVALVQSNGN